MGKFNDINVGDEVVILIPKFLKERWLSINGLIFKHGKPDQVEILLGRMSRTFVEELQYHNGYVILKTRSTFYNHKTVSHHRWILADNCAKVSPGFYEGMKFFEEEAKLA